MGKSWKYIIIISFLLSLNIAFSQNIEIKVPQTIQTIYTLEKTSIEITITNNGLYRDTFYLSVWPSRWVSLEKYFVTLDSGQSQTVELIIEPPIDVDVGNTVFTVSARSIDSGASESKEMVLNIRRKTGTYISDIKLNQELVKPGDTLFIQPVLVNMDKTESKHVIITTKILKDGTVIQSFEDEVLLEPAKTKTLTIPFPIYNKYVYGIYTIDVLMSDQLGQPTHKKSTSFGIQKFDEIKEEKSVERGLLYSTIIINVTNKGNIPSSSYTVTESMPKISKYFFHPDVEPISEEIKDNRVVYSWVVSGLDPDESVIIEYQFRFANVVILSAILFLLFILGVSYYYKPLLLKKYSKHLVQDKESLISLHVKNNSQREIKNIKVKDHVPPIAVVVKEFDTLKPDIKTTQKGTSLLWKIDKLRPKEERILTYRIKPVVRVEGSIRLPKAHFTYRTTKGIIDKIAEKIVITAKKIK